MNYQHNCKLLKSLSPGDLVRFPRRSTTTSICQGIYKFDHWVVFIGGKEVIHLGYVASRGFSVRLDNFWDVAKDSRAEKDHPLEKVMRGDGFLTIIGRAFSMLEKEGYNLFTWNCEHFATFCRYGYKISLQVSRLLTFRGLSFASTEELIDVRMRDEPKYLMNKGFLFAHTKLMNRGLSFESTGLMNRGLVFTPEELTHGGRRIALIGLMNVGIRFEPVGLMNRGLMFTPKELMNRGSAITSVNLINRQRWFAPTEFMFAPKELKNIKHTFEAIRMVKKGQRLAKTYNCSRGFKYASKGLLHRKNIFAQAYLLKRGIRLLKR